jgi:Na+-transporting NADH:ubiquinone oxidoreductase subunit B
MWLMGYPERLFLGSLAAKEQAAYSSFDMFMGYIPGSVAETSTLLILVGALIMLFAKVASWRIILSSFIGAAIMGLIFNALPSMGIEGNELTNFPWYNHL